MVIIYDPPYNPEPHLPSHRSSWFQASGKLSVLDKLLTQLKSEGSRVLIFSQASCPDLRAYRTPQASGVARR